MRRNVSIGIIFLLIGLSIAPSISSTNIIIVKEFGKSKIVIRVDDDGDGDYTSIQDAIDNATSEDIIEVYSGEYNELISIDKQITLVGIDHELGSGSGTGKPLLIGEGSIGVITLIADGCSISGFFLNTPSFCRDGILVLSDYNNIFQNDVKNINFGIHLELSENNKVYNNNHIKDGNMAIVISNSHNNQIYNNDIKEVEYGIWICNFAENNTIFSNTIYDMYADGIHNTRSNNNTFYNNSLTSCKEGIRLWMEDGWGYGMIVYDNSISSCKRGILVTGQDHKIYQNNITNCEYGIHMETIESIPPIYCQRNEVYDNDLLWNEEIGLWIDIVYFNDIYNNEIKGNGIHGILIWKSAENIIYENNISYNIKYGIHSWNSGDNCIYHNNIIGNTMNAWDDGLTSSRNNWDDGKYGNYWDDYTGEDDNEDGVGDRPYVIPDMDNNPSNNNKDKYPLMELWGSVNFPPNTPEIEGKRTFKAGEGGIYPYTIYSKDPNGDNVCYLINWSDGTEEWTGNYPSGEEITINVTIPLEMGTYEIFKIKAKDIYGALSEWGTLTVTMPRNRAVHNTLFYRLLEQFPILQKILCYIF